MHASMDVPGKASSGDVVVEGFESQLALAFYLAVEIKLSLGVFRV